MVGDDSLRSGIKVRVACILFEESVKDEHILSKELSETEREWYGREKEAFTTEV